MPFYSSAIYARVYGIWKETSNEVVGLTEFDEHTIGCALSYFYALDYCAFPVASMSDLELDHDTKNEDFEVSEKGVHNDCLADGTGSTCFVNWQILTDFNFHRERFKGTLGRWLHR